MAILIITGTFVIITGILTIGDDIVSMSVEKIREAERRAK